MRRLIVSALALACLASVGAAESDDQRPAALAAVEALRTALRSGDAAAAVALTFDNGDARIRAETQRQLAAMALEHAAGRSGFTILEAHLDGDAGFVLIDEDLKDGKPATDIDPIPLVRRDGRWLALGDATPTDAALGLDAATIEAFARLRTVIKERKAPLSEERRARRAVPAAAP